MNVWKIGSGAERRGVDRLQHCCRTALFKVPNNAQHLFLALQNQFSPFRPTDLYALPPQAEGSQACPELRQSQSIDSSVSNNTIQHQTHKHRLYFSHHPVQLTAQLEKEHMGTWGLEQKSNKSEGLPWIIMICQSEANQQGKCLETGGVPGIGF